MLTGMAPVGPFPSIGRRVPTAIAQSAPAPRPWVRVNDSTTDVPSLDTQSTGVLARGSAAGFLVSAYAGTGAIHFVCAPYSTSPLTGYSVSANGGAGWTDKGPVTPNNLDGPSPCSLIELMEGVEDIPGTAPLRRGALGCMATFPEYLDFLATRNFTIDVRRSDGAGL